jgi:MoaA/NifB/PqqE/SkfB family radical SAM enzyme
MIPNVDVLESALSEAELAKRNNLKQRKPYIAGKLARIADMEERGEISPIIRLEKSYLCNFQCTHCSAEYYMDRHIKNVIKIADTRQKMDLEDVRRLSQEADSLGLARFVITGGEPLVMKDFDAVVEAIDPDRHYIVTDTNGWFLDKKKATHLKSIGVEKVQLSLDSSVAEDHDNFRNKPGSYKRVIRAVDASLDAGLNIILSTVLIKGRAKTQEFKDLCEYCKKHDIGLYVSYAKPTGSCTDHPEFVIDKEDADILREMEKKYKVFTHMTPSYGSFKGCITTKGIITVTSTMEVTPCPYIDFSLGNLRTTPLKEVLARGMRNPWLGPYRPDCLIGEDPKFIKIHMEKTKGVPHLPVPWGKGFSDEDQLIEQEEAAQFERPTQTGNSHFDATGRCQPSGVTAPVHQLSRRYFSIAQPAIDYAAIRERIAEALGTQALPSVEEFRSAVEKILRDLEGAPETKSILSGVRVPFLLPQASHADIGEALDSTYLPAVGRAFKSVLPEFEFTNHNVVPLTKKLSANSQGRHDRLLARMAKSPVIGVYFPSLSEYSINAAREKVAQLPEKFVLAGGVDTCAALISAPDLLLNKDGYPPLLWLAGLEAEKPEAGYHFEAYGYNLTFNRRVHFGEVAEYWNSGLVLLA